LEIRNWVEPPWLVCGTPCRNHLPGEKVELLGEEELGGTTLVGLWNPILNHVPGEKVELLGEEELGGTTLVGLWNPM